MVKRADTALVAKGEKNKPTKNLPPRSGFNKPGTS